MAESAQRDMNSTAADAAAVGEMDESDIDIAWGRGSLICSEAALLASRGELPEQSLNSYRAQLRSFLTGSDLTWHLDHLDSLVAAARSST